MVSEDGIAEPPWGFITLPSPSANIGGRRKVEPCLQLGQWRSILSPSAPTELATSANSESVNGSKPYKLPSRISLLYLADGDSGFDVLESDATLRFSHGTVHTTGGSQCLLPAPADEKSAGIPCKFSAVTNSERHFGTLLAARVRVASSKESIIYRVYLGVATSSKA